MSSIAGAEFRMGVRARPMQPEDVAECTKIIAKHPVIGPRYGERIKDLRTAWLQLLGSEATAMAVFEKSERNRIRTCGVGVSVFVHDDFMRALKTPPLFWFGPELAKQIIEGDSPVLADKEVRESNSNEGLNLLVWEACLCPEFARRPDLYHLMVGTFIEMHRGFHWKEAITSQAVSGERLRRALEAGGWLWNPAEGRYVRWSGNDAAEIAENPHIIGITRELELERPGTWVGSLFDYHPPQIVFSRGEQRLLVAALRGRTDEELAVELAISLATVKNMWRSIYNRAASCLPEVFTDQSQEDLENSHRGKEKRRRLLAYLRECPEELRPVSRRVFRQGIARYTVRKQG